MTSLESRQAAFKYERQNPQASPSQAFMAGYLYHSSLSSSIDDEPSVDAAGLNPTFDTFWQLYDYKKAKPQAQKMWNRLTKAQQQEVIHSLPAYIASTPDKQYRMHPATYLNPNNERWKDEITNHEQSSKPTAEQQRFAAYAQAISNVARQS